MQLLRPFRAIMSRIRRHRRSIGSPYVVTAAEAAKHCMPVSRHGVADDGIRCPRCCEPAVSPGEWGRIHQIDRGEGVIEEAACCWNCNAFLMASPDDDIDPVRQGEPYDRATYHRFVRPPGWTPPRQTTLDRPPKVGDWIVVWESHQSKGRDLLNAEGEVLAIDGETATIRPSGFTGMSTARAESVPVSKIRAMAFEVYRAGMRVRVLLGKHRGCTGTIVALKGAQLTVDDGDKTFTTIQEHVQRLDLE